MCIVVDANAASDLSGPTEDGTPVLKWLLSDRNPRGRLILGGRLAKELAKSGLQKVMVTLNQAGRLIRIDDDKIKKIEGELLNSKELRSDDPHVIALLKAANCELIFSKDKNLHKDLKNQKIIRPSPSIYQTSAHQHLLAECKCG